MPTAPSQAWGPGVSGLAWQSLGNREKVGMRTAGTRKGSQSVACSPFPPGVSWPPLLFIHRELSPFKEPALQLPLRPLPCWIQLALEVSPSLLPTPPARWWQVPVKDVRRLLRELVIYSFSLLFSWKGGERNVHWKSEGLRFAPSAPGRAGNSSHASGGGPSAFRAAHIHISRGRRAAAASPGQCVN